MSAKVSVLMTVYSGDNPALLSSSIESISLNQTKPPSEIILIEDGPLNPELYVVLDSWKSLLGESLIRRSLVKNQGIASALNYGLTLCSCEYIARMDADDISMHDRLEKQANYLSMNPSVDIVGAWAIEIDENNKIGHLRKKPVRHTDIFNALWLNPLIHPSVMYRLSVISEIGMYNPKLKRSEDYDLWFRAAQNGRCFYNIPEPLIYYRFSSDSHKKQSSYYALERSIVGYWGCTNLKFKWYLKIACFYPFIRSIFPSKIQHLLYLLIRYLHGRWNR